MELLGLKRVGKYFLRSKKDNGLYLVNEETLCPLFDEPIDCVLDNLGYYHSGPFVVIKDGLSTVFDKEGNPLTNFVKGQFKWTWARFENKEEHHIIYNEEAQIAFYLV